MNNQKCDKRITTYNQLSNRKETCICGKQVYKGTFCKHHWNKNKQKTTPFNKRIGYREPTMTELKSGKRVYAKDMTSYGGYYYREGFMIKGPKNKNNPPTKYPPDPKLFVIKLNDILIKDIEYLFQIKPETTSRFKLHIKSTIGLAALISEIMYGDFESLLNDSRIHIKKSVLNKIKEIKQ